MTTILIWASSNPWKYWNKILKHLITNKEIVIPINPNLEEIEWFKCYKNISEVNIDFDKVVFVVNPTLTLEIIKNNFDKISNKKLWFQPWTYDEEILNFCKNNNLDFESVNCILKV